MILPSLATVQCLMLVGLPIGLLVSYSIIKFHKPLCHFPWIILYLSFGFIYATTAAHALLAAYLPSEWEGKDILIEGRIHGVPVAKERRTQLLFQVDKIHTVTDTDPVKQTRFGQHNLIRLSWYDKTIILHSGERWQLKVRLKRPNGFLNPGGFDYEKWLFTQRITAVGYVRSDTANQRLAASPWWWPHYWRERINAALQQALPEHAMTGLLQGLAVAQRDAISDAQWTVLRQTGTSHLLAISGLHIALVAGFALLPLAALWWCLPRLYLHWPVRIAGGVLGALFATLYAVLAGFSLPTQRALVMVLVLLGSLLMRRRVPLSLSLAVALFAVIVLDPLASLSAGFWLSFGAVALIGVLIKRQRKAAAWLLTLRVQLGLSLGMLPLTALFFGQFSLSSPLANVVAIPWVSFLVVPWVLLGVVIWPLSTTLADALWTLAAQSLHYLFLGLQWLSEQSWSAWSVPALPWHGVCSVLVAVGLLLLPARMPGRYLGLIGLLPLILWQPIRPANGAFTLTLLDVGQGLAVAVQTNQHVLLFDAGPRSASGFDTGELVVLPWLRAQGIQELDALMVSHSDRDHSGGVGAVLAAMPVKQLWVSRAGQFSQPERLCRAGQQWQWDGVTFAVLHPSPAAPDQDDNNYSCVLRVSNATHSALLVADIEAHTERWLIKQGWSLTAEVLLAGHHGSKTSSSAAWLDAVQPELALVSAGYRSRYGHPHNSVQQRYQQRGVPLWNTAQLGAIQVDFPASELWQAQAYRQERGRFWNR